VEEERKEKEYLEWLYGLTGSNDTSTVFRMQNAQSATVSDVAEIDGF
jgi:hypothetical protein